MTDFIWMVFWKSERFERFLQMDTAYILTDDEKQVEYKPLYSNCKKYISQIKSKTLDNLLVTCKETCVH